MDSVKNSGILSGGYGVTAKRVMKDESLSIEAKAIYAYLCSYAGSDGSAFPSVGLMAKELGISEQRLKKYRQQLVLKGYITIERRRKNGKQASNLYVIEMQPECFQGSQKQTPENLTAEKQTPENNRGTKNSETKNSLTTNNETTTSSSKKDKIDYQAWRDAYTENVTNLGGIRAMSDSRKAAVRSMLKNGITIDDFKEACKIANESDFLTGGGSRGWKASAEWMFNVNNVIKVLEGNYGGSRQHYKLFEETDDGYDEIAKMWGMA